jgi:hypothetical protein
MNFYTSHERLEVFVGEMLYKTMRLSMPLLTSQSDAGETREYIVAVQCVDENVLHYWLNLCGTVTIPDNLPPGPQREAVMRQMNAAIVEQREVHEIVRAYLELHVPPGRLRSGYTTTPDNMAVVFGTAECVEQYHQEREAFAPPGEPLFTMHTVEDIANILGLKQYELQPNVYEWRGRNPFDPKSDGFYLLDFATEPTKDDHAAGFDDRIGARYSREQIAEAAGVSIESYPGGPSE